MFTIPRILTIVFGVVAFALFLAMVGYSKSTVNSNEIPVTEMELPSTLRKYPRIPSKLDADTLNSRRAPYPNIDDDDDSDDEHNDDDDDDDHPQHSITHHTAADPNHNKFRTYRGLTWWADIEHVPENVRVGYIYPPFYYDEANTQSLTRLCSEGIQGGVAHLMYIHLYKTGGNNMDDWLENYAKHCGIKFVDWHSLKYDDREQSLASPRLYDLDTVAKVDILGGHFAFGLHALYQKAVYTTIIRRPEWAFVSGIVYKARKVPKQKAQIGTFEDALKFIDGAIDMRVHKSPEFPHRDDFVWRMSGRIARTPEEAHDDALVVIQHLKQFSIVGLTEEWEIMVEMYQKMLDPNKNWRDWDTMKVTVGNANGMYSTSELVAALPENVKAKLREYCKYDRMIYDEAVKISYEHCLKYIKDEAKCAPTLKYANSKL